MKILLVISSFYPATVYGGPIFSTLHTSKELSKIDGVKVFVATTNANMKSKLQVETNKWVIMNKNFYVKYYNESKVNIISLRLLFNLWHDIKDIDIVHIQYIYTTPTIISMFYAMMFSKPIILSPRGSLCEWCLEHGSRFKKLWNRFFIAPFANKIIWHATSIKEKEEILKQFPSAKVEIIPNGIEFEKFQEWSKFSKKQFCKKFIQQDLNIDKIIVSMGRLQKIKGFDILINAFSEVLLKYPNSALFIAGEDEGEFNSLSMQISKLKLYKHVFLIGAIYGQDKIDFLANADLFVLASHTENFGNVYLESLAAGTPIIATKGTPWSEVEEANCGKWVKNNINEIGQAMIEMFGEDREQMRKNSINVAQKYDWKNIATQFNKLFIRNIK